MLILEITELDDEDIESKFSKNSWINLQKFQSDNIQDQQLADHFSKFFTDHRIVAISDVDTRALKSLTLEIMEP